MNKITFIISLIVLVLVGCTDFIEIETENFENILVINANITSDNKKQKVSISRTYKSGFEKVVETEAEVFITDNLNNTYFFSEEVKGEGVYLSNSSFAVLKNRQYQLTVITSDGERYTSSFVEPINTSVLENVRPVYLTNDLGEEGIGIKVDSYDSEGIANYFRYEYEETYQIISPIVTAFDLNIVSENPAVVEIVDKEDNEQVCYNTLYSNDILIANSEQLGESRVSNFQIKFIPKFDFKIRNRYSILVHQFVQSREANAFYNSLKEFSSSENLFSQTQPGFITGNIKSSNENVKVIGFFEVSMVSSKRIFFNHKDLIPDFNNSPFPFDCNTISFNTSQSSLMNMIDLLKAGRYEFTTYDYQTNTYGLVERECVDCTILGSTTKPDFWID